MKCCLSIGVCTGLVPLAPVQLAPGGYWHYRGASGTTYHFAKATWLFHSVFYPTLTLGVKTFRYLILNKKIVIYLVHIQGMSDFFDWRETVKTLFYLSYTDTGNQPLRVNGNVT